MLACLYAMTHARLAASDKIWLSDNDPKMLEAEAVQGEMVPSFTQQLREPQANSFEG